MFEEGKQKKMFEVLIFLLKLLLLSVLLYSILWWGDLTLLREFTASKVSSFFRVIGFPITQEGTTLFLGKVSFSMTRDCTGWKGLVFLFALVVSVKVSLKEKLKGLAVNLPIIYSVNLLRIAGIMVLTYWYGSEAYGYFHDFFWQFTMIISVLLLWVVWFKRANFNN